MALFILRKLILQTRMRSYPVGLDVWFLVGPFVYFHTSCLRTANALARLRGCAGSPEHSLVAYVISTIISWASIWLIHPSHIYRIIVHTFAIVGQVYRESEESIATGDRPVEIWECGVDRKVSECHRHISKGSKVINLEGKYFIYLKTGTSIFYIHVWLLFIKGKANQIFLWNYLL